MFTHSLCSIQCNAWFSDSRHVGTSGTQWIDFVTRLWNEFQFQYVQQANQVVSKYSDPRVYVNDGPESNMFGIAPNYGCCTANFNQVITHFDFEKRFELKRIFLTKSDGIEVHLEFCLLFLLWFWINSFTLKVINYSPLNKISDFNTFEIKLIHWLTPLIRHIDALVDWWHFRDGLNM